MKPSIGLSLCMTLLFTSGCATHLPMSDSIMFHDRARTRPAHRTPIGLGVAMSQAVSSTDFLQNEAYRRWYVDGASGRIEPINVGVRGEAFYVALYNAGTFSLSGSFGPNVIGADMTAKLYGRNYVTASGSLWGGSQLIFQHRAFNSPALGAAVGLFYRQDRASFDVQLSQRYEEAPCEYCERSFYVNTIGGTATVVGRLVARGESAPGPLRATLQLGYVPEYNRVVVRFGAAIGIF